MSLDGVAYEVDAVLVGETVSLRYDPSKPGRSIQVWLKGSRVQEAKVVDVRANCFVRREQPGLKLSDLAGKEE